MIARVHISPSVLGTVHEMGGKVFDNTEAHTRPGDIVVAIPSEVQGWFAGALVTVTEVKPWGIQGRAHAIESDASKSKPSGHAYIRLKWSQFEHTGGINVYRLEDEADHDAPS